MSMQRRAEHKEHLSPERQMTHSKHYWFFIHVKTWRNEIKFCAPFDEWGNKTSMLTDKRHCAASFNYKSRGMQTAFSPVDFCDIPNSAVWKCLTWPSHISFSDSGKLLRYFFLSLLCNISKYSRQQFISKRARCVLLIVESRGVHQDSCRSGCGRRNGDE